MAFIEFIENVDVALFELDIQKPLLIHLFTLYLPPTSFSYRRLLKSN